MEKNTTESVTHGQCDARPRTTFPAKEQSSPPLRSCREVRRRIALGKEAFNKKKDLMQKSLSFHLRKRSVKVFVWSVVLYGSETWTLQKEDIRRLEAFETWIWRRVMKVSWNEHKTNEEVLQMVDTEREMMVTLRSRQKRRLGHILRHDSLLRITLEG